MDIIEFFNGNIPAKNGKVTDGVMKVLYSMQSNVFLLGGESRSKEGIVEFLGLVDISFSLYFLKQCSDGSPKCGGCRMGLNV